MNFSDRESSAHPTTAYNGIHGSALRRPMKSPQRARIRTPTYYAAAGPPFSRVARARPRHYYNMFSRARAGRTMAPQQGIEGRLL